MGARGLLLLSGAARTVLSFVSVPTAVWVRLLLDDPQGAVASVCYGDSGVAWLFGELLNACCTLLGALLVSLSVVCLVATLRASSWRSSSRRTCAVWIHVSLVAVCSVHCVLCCALSVLAHGEGSPRRQCDTEGSIPHWAARSVTGLASVSVALAVLTLIASVCAACVMPHKSREVRFSALD
eukprot:m51a1_g6107 hypothetical protein (182) ;mRNA; f:84984-85611